MLAKELKELKKVKPTNLLMLTLAGVINAFGVTIFIAPVNLYDSGVSGTSILLSQLTPDYLSLSVFLLVLNIPLFLYGLKKEGLLFTVYAIYTVAVYAFVAWLITDVLPVDVSMASPLAGSDLLLCALFGGLLSGMGSGLAIRSGGAMDGIEVLAVIFAGHIGISVGSFVMIYNLALYIVAGVVLNSWIRGFQNRGLHRGGPGSGQIRHDCHLQAQGDLRRPVGGLPMRPDGDPGEGLLLQSG